MTCAEAVVRLWTMASPDNVTGMARYGINTAGAPGVPMPRLRAIAREIRRDHAVALELWETGIHEARILASLVADPALVTPRQAARWLRDVDSWDVCDQRCQNLLRYTPFAFEKAAAWSGARAGFTRRAAFSLMAGLAVKSKEPDEAFYRFLPLIVAASSDERNMVKKGVNWALPDRQTRRRIEVARHRHGSGDPAERQPRRPLDRAGCFAQTAGRGSPPGPREAGTIGLMRVVLLLACALARGPAQSGPADAVEGKLVIRAGNPALDTGDRGLVALAGDAETLQVLRDRRLGGASLQARGRFTAPGRFAVDPIHTRAMLVRHDGRLKLITYWCGICSIRTYTPGECWCCQEETTLDPRDPDAQ